MCLCTATSAHPFPDDVGSGTSQHQGAEIGEQYHGCTGGRSRIVLGMPHLPACMAGSKKPYTLQPCMCGA